MSALSLDSTDHSTIDFLFRFNPSKLSDFEGILRYFGPCNIIDIYLATTRIFYTLYANKLIEVGYNYIGLGGITTRPTDEIIEIISELRTQIPNTIQIHLFGFNRINRLDEFHGYDITSFDSTSPILKSFKDAKNNYFSNIW